MKITDYLDRVANDLESMGFFKEAYEIDVLANTLDLMTAPGSVTERERNEEFNFVVLEVKKNPYGAKQSLTKYWGPTWGPIMFDIANKQAISGRTVDMFPQWQRASLQASQDKPRKTQVQPTKDDPFMSPEEIARLKKPTSTPDPHFLS